MNILSDEKILHLWCKYADTAPSGERRIAFARAIEAAVLEAQAGQGPVAYGLFCLIDGKEYLQFPVGATEEDCKQDMQMFSDIDQEKMTIRALYAAPVVQPGMVNYIKAQEVAHQFGLDYNKFCAAYRAMIAAAEGKK